MVGFSRSGSGPGSWQGPSRRRALQSAGGAAVGLGLLAWWLLPEGAEQPSGRLVMATGTPTGVYARYGTVLRQQIGLDLPKVDVRLWPSEGSVQNIERVASRHASLTIAQADAVADYLENDGRGADRLRACARLYDDYVQLVVPDRSKVRRVQHLAGLRVGIGEPRSGVNLVAERLLRAADLDIDRDLTTVPAGVDRTPKLLRSGDLDAFFWTGGLPTMAIERLAESTPIRLVPLAALMPALRAQDVAARYYRAAMMPADTYPALRGERAVQTIAVPNLLVTTDRVERALIKGVTQSVIRGRDGIAGEVHAAQLVDLRTAIYTAPLELHEGARDFYRSVKL